MVGHITLTGMPDFIEIKAVTFCGKSDASDLEISNTPWHDEVLEFSTQICQHLGGAYGRLLLQKNCCTLPTGI